MAFRVIARLVAVATLFAITYLSGVVRSAPSEFDGLDQQARDILARATPAAPHFVIYSDKGTSGITGPPPPAQVKVIYGFTMLVSESWLTPFHYPSRALMLCMYHIFSLLNSANTYKSSFLPPPGGSMG